MKAQALAAVVVSLALGSAVVGISPVFADDAVPEIPVVDIPVEIPAREAAEPPVTNLIVKYKPGVPVQEARGVATGSGSVDDVELEPGRAMSLGMRTVELSEPLTQAEAKVAAAELTQDPRVAFASPDDWFTPTSATNPNDPYYQADDIYQWSLKTGYGINGPAAWAQTTGSSDVVVAVLDSGILTHPDLDPNMAVAGYDFISDVTVANDGNARDPDPVDSGDWCGDEPSSWHGTHVSGVINAWTDNDEGVASVAPGVKTQPVRVLGKCGGAGQDLVDALTWASGGSVPGVADNPTPAAIINMSLGGAGTCSIAQQSAIDAAVARGSTVVVAAGNGGVNVSTVQPASCTNIVVVAATDIDGARAVWSGSSSSNYGAGVDLAAPGALVLSTWNDGTTVAASSVYAYMGGTSQATPNVAGLAALIKSRFPTLTPAEIEARLKANVTAFPGGVCDAGTPSKTCGTGVANAASVTVGIGPDTPDPPTGVKANGAVDVSWSAPNSNGNTITGYTVKTYASNVLQAGKTCSTTWVDPTPAATSCQVTGLTNGTAYTFTVTATNSVGTSGESVKSSAVTPSTVPAVPAAPTGVASDSAAIMSWVAPSNGGSAITGYEIKTYLSDVEQVGDGCTTLGALTCTVSGLTNGQEYTFTVSATNANGTTESPASVGITPAVGPAAPAAPTAVGGNARATVTWVAPVDSGSPITGYTVKTFKAGVEQVGKTCTTTTAVTCAVTGLANGTAYTFTVTATDGNQSATSPASTAVVPATVPSAVRALRATYRPPVARVTWAVPTSNGGAAITSYRYRWSNNNGRKWFGWKSTRASAVSIPRALRARQRVQVQATNRVGAGPVASISLAVRVR